MDKKLFDNLIESCKEAIEYENGDLQLKTNTLEILEDEADFYDVYGKLTDVNKQKIMQYAEELLQASG